MDEVDQGAKMQPVRSAPPVPIGGPVRSAPARPPSTDITRATPRPPSTGPGSFKSNDTNRNRPEITIVSARPMSEVDFGSSTSVKPLDRNGSVPTSTNGLPADPKAPPPMPQGRPKGSYIPPPLPTTRPKAAYTPPSKSRTSSVCSSSTASPVLSRKSPVSEVVSPADQTCQVMSGNGSISVEFRKEPTAKKSERPQRPASGPHFSTPSPSPVVDSPVETSSSGKLTPIPRPRIKSISEKSQSGRGTPDDASIKESESSTNDKPPFAPPPLPTNRPSRKYTVIRGTSVEAKTNSEKFDTVKKNSSDNTATSKRSVTPIEKQTAVGELEKAVENNKKPAPPHTAAKPPKLAAKPVHQPKPTPKPTARVAFPPPPSSPKSEHKMSSPLARPRPRVKSTEETSDKHTDNESNSSFVMPSALSVSAAIKGLNSAKSNNNSFKSSTNRTKSPFNIENSSVSKPAKPTPSPNPFSSSKPMAGKTSEISAMQTVTVDAKTLSTASKGLSALSSTMSAFEPKPKPQTTNSRPPPSNWNAQVPDAAALSAAASGLSAMSSAAASVSKFQSSVDRQQPTATVRTTQPSIAIPDAATISNAAKGLSFLSSVSSQSRPVATARVQPSSQTKMPTSTSLNSMNLKPLLPQKSAAFVPSQSAMKDIANLFDPIATEKPQQTKTAAASRNSDLLLALGGGKMSAPTRKAPSAPKSKPRASPTPNRKQINTPPVQQAANTNTSLLLPKAVVRPTIIRPSAKPSNKKKAPARPISGPNLKQMKKKAAPMQPTQSTAMKNNSKKSNGKTKRPAPVRPGATEAVKSGLPPRPGPGHPLFKYTVEKPHGIAQFPFQATSNDELSFEEKDVIILLKEVNADWFRGRNKNKEGIFPKNYIKIIKPLSADAGKEMESQIEEITGPCAVALHVYRSADAGDLSFNAGDNIQLLEKMDDQWYKGECNGSTGMFPKNFVEVIEDIPESANIKGVLNVSGPRCKARFDYEGDEAADLSFEEGSVIKLVSRIGDEWLKGELKGRTGIFPQAYVEIIQDLPAEAASDDGIATALFDFNGADSSELNFKTGDKISVKSRINGEWLIGELNGIEGSFPANFINNIPENLPSAASSPCTVPSEIQGTCTALFDFEATDESELSLRTGDTITLLEAVGDDWLRGKVNGKEGVFPRNFVEMQDGSKESSKMTVKALFDFPAEMPDDLGFKVDDIITDVASYSGDWYEGRLNGKVGRFPSNFVEVISS